MVEEQLRARDIRDARVLKAFFTIERHRFVPEELRSGSYGDHPLSIGYSQTISQPYIVALMTESLALAGNEKVLEIGTGSGYQTAILAALAKEVFSIERIEPLAAQAQNVIRELGYSNVTIKAHDGTLGWIEHAPFDRIIVAAACPSIPLPLIEQLKDSGRLIMPLGESFSQVLTLATKRNNRLETTQLCACVFVPLIGKFAYSDTQ